MDADRFQEVDHLLEAVLSRPAEEREAFLRRACGGDEALEREVRSLVSSHQEAGSFLEGRALEAAAQALARVQDHTPSTIGRYRIVRRLGEGGMGVVYEAVQENPHRPVALKVVRPGLALSNLRRFEHESQTLARLQHPGIAQIYEAGTADSGAGPQPFFAMEFIRGMPLGEYVEAHHLSPRKRLELMVKICEAVDHAHQRGVIHRDLKPGNILVEAGGQPKILDFGVARVTDGDAPVTRQTDVGQLIGTLEYMSPEQVLADPMEVDTRSDVYSLGVILYEVLAGRRPYKLSGQLHEAVRTIREEDPAPLSSISRDYRGDIETIVAKALEKDKGRRYGSAAALVADIERYLADEPITARPPSAIYQLQKFARRHRALVAGVAAVFVVLAAGVLVSTGEAVRASRAQQAAEKEAATSKAVTDFLQNDLLAQASATAQAGTKIQPDPNLKVRTALDRAAARISGRFASQPLVEASLRQTIGSTYLDLGLYTEAQREIELALLLRKRTLGENDAATLQSDTSLADVLRAQGRYADAETSYRRILETQARVLGESHRDTLVSMNKLIAVLADETKYAQASELVSKTLAIERRAFGEERPETLRTLLNQAALARDLGKLPQSEALIEKVLGIQRRTLGEDHPDTLATMDLLGLQYREEGKFPQSESVYARVLEIRSRVQGKEHPDTLQAMNALAILYRVNGKYAQAEEMFKQVLEIGRKILGAEHPITIVAMAELPGVYWVEGKYAEAESLYIKALEIRRRLVGEEQDDTVSTMNNLATNYMSQGKFAQAEPLLLKVVEIRQRTRGADSPRTLISMNNLAVLYRHQGKYSQAEALFAKVLEDRRRVLGKESPDTLKTLDALGSLYRVEGNLPQAEAFLTRALAERRRVLGERHADTLLTLSNLARVYLDQRKYDQAGTLFDQVLQGRRSVLGADHPDTIGTLNAIGEMQLQRRQYSEAEAALREAMVHEQTRSPDNWDRYDTQSMLGAALAGQGNYSEAEPLLLSGYQGLREREARIPVPERPTVARAGQRIIQLYENWAKPEAAATWRVKLRRGFAGP